MADITITPASVKRLPNSVTRNIKLSEIVDVGEWIYVDANGEAALADASLAATVDDQIGMVTNIGTLGKTTGAIGDMATVVMFGPISLGDTTLTPGQLFASDTAGKLGTVGTVKAIAGVILADGVLFINPYVPQ